MLLYWPLSTFGSRVIVNSLRKSSLHITLRSYSQRLPYLCDMTYQMQNIPKKVWIEPWDRFSFEVKYATNKVIRITGSCRHSDHMHKYTDLRSCACIYVCKGENCFCVLTSWQHQRAAVYVNIGPCPTDDCGLLQAFSTFPNNYACVHVWLLYQCFQNGRASNQI